MVMRLSRKIEKALVMVAICSLAVFFGFLFSSMGRNTFAESENEDGYFNSYGPKFVTIYEGREKLTVKTDAKTVGELLERVKITLGEGDKIEPSLESEIDVDNYFVNIYRARPVIVKDGIFEQYLMTASFDKKNVMREAGIEVYDGDEIKLTLNNNFLEMGIANVYEITRNGGREITEEEEIPFGEQRIKDYNLAPGVSEVRQLGEAGAKQIVYNVLYIDGVEVSREKIAETVVREPVVRIVAVGASEIERKPLTPSMGRNRYTVRKSVGTVFERQETFYDLNMSGVIKFCGTSYSVRSDGVKIDQDGYVLVAANLSRYPRCSIVETSLGLGKVYDTGTFAATNPEQFDIATDWTRRDGK